MFDSVRNRIENWMHPKEEISGQKLFDLLFSRLNNEDAIIQIESDYGLEIAKRPVQVAVIHVGDGVCSVEKLDTIIKSCRAISDSEEVLPVHDGCSQAILLFFCDTVWEDQARQILGDIKKDFLSNYPDTNIYITLGTVESYIEGKEPSWRRSYIKATGLQDYRYVKPKGKIIAYSDIIKRRGIYPRDIEFRFGVLKKYLESDTPDQARQWLSSAYSALSEKHPDSLGLLFHLTLEIVVNAVSLFREKGISAESRIGLPEDLVREVLASDTPEDLKKWTENFMEKCNRILNSQ